MTLSRRFALCTVTLLALLAGCASAPPPAPPAARAALAPTGTLRVGVYPGSPTSMLRVPGSTEMRGVTVDLGRELGQRLGVPVEIVVFQRVAEVIDAMKGSRVDFTVTNATPARAADLDFTAPLIALELGYLSLPGSPVQAIDAVDQPGRRIGVSQGSSSQAALTRQFRQASVVGAPSLQAAGQMLAAREIDAFATNKGILFELADTLAWRARAAGALGPGAPGHRSAEGPRGRHAVAARVCRTTSRQRLGAARGRARGPARHGRCE